MATPLLETRNLKKYFSTKAGPLHAVDDVTFTLDKGKTLGVVGESGCGKSTLGRTVLHLLERTDGQIFFDGEDISVVSKEKLRQLRERMQIIFQDPMSSLNPRFSVSKTLKEPLFLSGKYQKSEIEDRVDRLMDTVGLAPRLREAYPHELDGGRRQRIGIGRALALDPDFIVCDEPVSALDVSIQAQVLNLMMDLQDQRGLTYIFITHDLSVVRHISDDILVMYMGTMVEKSPSKELFHNPVHPYTKALLSAVPSTNIHRKKNRIVLTGEVSNPVNPAPGCRFAKRCPYAAPQCSEPQVMEEVAPNHFVSCCRWKEVQ